MTEHYPGAVWVPADPSNYRRAARLGFSRVVIHCTDGRSDPRAVARMWQTPKHGSSAHFVVGPDGTIIQAVSLADVAYHAHYANADSVGIEHCCRTPLELGPDDPGLPITASMLLASAKLSAWLLRECGLQPSRQTIVGHAEADPQTTHAGCPESAGLLLGPYAVLVAAEYAELVAANVA